MLHTGKIKDIFKQSQSGTLSPMTTTTTSSGYSTGSSSISATAIPSLKKSFSPSTSVKKQQQQQQSSSLPLKSKPKGRRRGKQDPRVERSIHAQTSLIVLVQMTFSHRNLSVEVCIDAFYLFSLPIIALLTNIRGIETERERERKKKRRKTW